MKQLINLTGKQFGSLVVTGRSSRKTKWGGTYWVCQCTCGNEVVVRSDNLRRGRTTQCSECRCHAGRRSVFVKEVVEDGLV